MNMGNNPLVSIIIPAHNRPELLKRAVRSALNQTYEHIEVIVVDDASEVDILQSLTDDVRLTVVRNEVNKGASESRNIGVRRSSGAFINFLDDDDILYPEKVSMQIRKFRESRDPQLGMVTAHVKDHRSGETLIRRNRHSGNVYKEALSRFINHGIESVLYKRSCLTEVGGFDPELQSSQEYDLFIRVSKKYNIAYVDRILSEEFRSVDQISLNFDKKIRGARHLFSKHRQAYKNYGPGFVLRMRFKLWVLITRFYFGKYFGEKVYRLLIPSR